jgi:hypothetical protein
LQRHTLAEYVEVHLPLIAPTDGNRWAQSLQLSLAGRHEKYSDADGAFIPKAGFEWTPRETVTVRGTVGLSTHEPTLSDLNARNSTTALYTFVDPSAPNRLQSLLIRSGSNSALQNEQAFSWSTGLDVKPVWVSGLVLSATYFSVRFRDRILPITLAPDILSNAADQSYVTRNPTAAERHNLCGQTIFVSGSPAYCESAPVDAIVDLRQHNISTLRTSGVDFNISYSTEKALGRFDFRLDGTRLLRYSEVEAPGTSAVPLLNTPNNPIAFRFFSSMSLRRGNFVVDTSIDFSGRYRDTLEQPERGVDSWTTVGMGLGYDWKMGPHSQDSGIRIEVHANNLLNTHPPFLNNRLARIGYDQENADLGGRMLLLQLEWHRSPH